ncbi:hypothetical protein [Adhaeretor mobilis]|uniref:Uncharacterized protein n=1 Tax=Adhaeretor mobilis TaxID=1930276 RepID=A0A517N0H2_9BACT|nr:hypothetical protein [Adhaeretor mobilis]QDT00631.1 hypothetical protein HG15A2_39700 [Adhaeretor mobilis]
MHHFARRRWINATISVALVALVALWVRFVESSLGRSAYHTGWLLLAMLVALASYSLRKRLPVLPLGRSAIWLQAHLYIAFASVGIFLLHIQFRWPNGILESILACVFAATIISGLVGLYWTRTIPKKLAKVGEEVLYEEIPRLRVILRDRAQNMVLATVRTSGEATLGEYYEQRLRSYFARPRGWRYRLRPSSDVRKALMADLTEATRYFSDTERKSAEQLFSLVRRRDDLDYHDALQWRLKTWLFVHVALTYPLLLLALAHGWLAHLFAGGLS